MGARSVTKLVQERRVSFLLIELVAKHKVSTLLGERGRRSREHNNDISEIHAKYGLDIAVDAG